MTRYPAANAPRSPPRWNLADDHQHDGHPAIAAGLVRSYAGVPITLDTGHILGSYCLMDRIEHTFTDSDIADMITSAQQIVEAIGRHPRKPK